jgi:hypothetical protein
VRELFEAKPQDLVPQAEPLSQASERVSPGSGVSCVESEGRQIGRGCLLMGFRLGRGGESLYAIAAREFRACHLVAAGVFPLVSAPAPGSRVTGRRFPALRHLQDSTGGGSYFLLL